MADFYPADVGRDIVAGGGFGTITAYVDAQTVTVDVTTQFPATAFNARAWAILGSPLTSCTPSEKGPVGASVSLLLGANGWRPEDVGKFVRINGGLCQITSVPGPLTCLARVVAEMTSAVSAEAFAWSLEGSVWGGDYGYPRCGALFEQRLWLAGSPSFPLRVWGSTIGVPHDYTLGTLDDEALAYDLSTGEMNPIMHLATARGLIALTTGGEFSIRGGQDRAISPTNIKVTDQSNYGTGTVPPARIGNEIYFAQRAGRKVRALSLNQYDGEQYVAPDMAVLSEHITDSGIAAIAHQQEPESVLYVVRNDGQMATLTADRDQEVFGWARQTTQGAFEQVETVPTSDGYNVFVVVARTIGGETTRYVEMLEPGLHTDSAVTGSAPSPATVWSGLDHLEGMAVVVKGDGVHLGGAIVQGGQVTTPRACSSVEFGLRYTTTVLTLSPEFMGPNGSSAGSKMAAHNVTARLLESIGCSINLQIIPFRHLGDSVLDLAPQPYTGDMDVSVSGWDRGQLQTLVQQTLPYPFHLLSVITKLTANDG